jgi:hypothetical protein
MDLMSPLGIYRSSGNVRLESAKGACGDAKPLRRAFIRSDYRRQAPRLPNALRARTGGRNIVRGLATCFRGRVHDDDPRGDCIRLLVGRLVVG